MEQQPSGSKGFDLAAMALATKIIMVAGILLLVDSFLHWQQVCVPGVSVPGQGTFGGGCYGFSAWGGSGSFAGLLMGLLLIVLLIFEGTQLANVNMNLPIASTKISAYLAWAVAVFAIIKLLLVLGNEPAIWAYIGVVLALVVAYGGFLHFQAAEPTTAPPPPAS